MLPATKSTSVEARAERAATRVANSLARCSRSLCTLDRSGWLMALATVALDHRPLIRGGGDPLPDETTIRQRFRTLIDSGALPRFRPRRVWAGPCREAHSCAACGITIAAGETEVDIILPAGVKIFIHPRCMNLWPGDGDGGGSASFVVTERVARAVLDHFPYAHCFSCLAAQLGLTEPEVRSAAQRLVLRGVFMTVSRVCYGCQHAEVTLVPDKEGARK